MTSSIDVFDIIDREDWINTPSTELLYSFDHIVDAYEKGEKAGFTSALKPYVMAAKTNLDSTSAHVGELVDEVKLLGFNPISAYLRMENWDDFKVLLTIPEDEYVSSNILALYKVKAAFEKKVRTDSYFLSFNICPKTSDFDESVVASDDYALKYKKLG